MAPPKKPVAQYEAEAVRVGGCLVHPGARGVARTVWQKRNGRRLTTREYVCHTCDNPKCIEAAHHFIGTPRDNVRDAVQKGRHSCFHPNVHGRPKFTRPRTDDERRRIGEGLRRAYLEGRR